MIFRTKHLVNTFLYLIQGPKFWGSSPPSQSSTVTQATIPDELKPYIKSYMTAAENQTYQKNDKGEITGIQPYKAYGGTYDAAGNQTAYDPSKGIADFSPLQKQAQQEAGALQAPTAAFDSASNMAQTAGAGQLESAQLANAYGQQGSSIGNQAESRAVNQGGDQIYAAGQAGQGAYDMGAANNQSAISNTNNQIQNAGAYGAQGSAIGANVVHSTAAQTNSQIGQAQQLGMYGINVGAQGAANANAQATSQIGQAGGYGAQGSAIGANVVHSTAAQTNSQIGQAGGYGAQGSNIGAAAAGQAGQGYNAQANFAQQATDPNAVGAYMSPYMQNVTNQQIIAANRQYDITGSQEMANATRANAFGGSREALMAAENERARNSDISGIQAKGLQDAFSNAQSQQQFGANLGIQGLNAGTAAMQTGISGANAGIAGVGAQTAATNANISAGNTGIAGANTGLAGVGAQTAASNMGIQGTQLAQTGIAQGQTAISEQTAATNANISAGNTGIAGANTGLAGVGAQTAATNAATNATSTGISGANAKISGVGAQTAVSNMERSAADTALAGNAQGLAGVNAAQAGYAGATQAATTTGNLAAQGLATQVSTIEAKQKAGQQITAREQSILDQAVLDYGNGQNNATNKIGTMSNLVHGINTTSSVTRAPQTSLGSQIAGAGVSLGGAYLAGRGGNANGGVIKDNSYAGGGSVEGSMRGKLEDLDSTHLQEIIKTNSSPEMTKLAKDVLASKYAKGGIVAFAGEDGSLVNDPVYNARLKKEPTGIQQAQQAPVDPMANLQAASSAAQKEADIPIADRIQQQKALEDKFVGADTETAAYRKSIMDERANAPDEARRQMGMRLMEFGANWASTPGAPLVAGMKALTSTLPGIMSDSKDNKKMMKDLDKSEYLLNHATRLEELGQIKEATAAKDKASELFMHHQESLVKYGLKKQQLEQEATIAQERNASSERQQAMSSGSHLASAQIAANVGNTGNKQVDRDIDNLQKQQVSDDKRYAALIEAGEPADLEAAKALKVSMEDDRLRLRSLLQKPKTKAELEQEEFTARHKREQE